MTDSKAFKAPTDLANLLYNADKFSRAPIRVTQEKNDSPDMIGMLTKQSDGGHALDIKARLKSSDIIRGAAVLEARKQGLAPGSERNIERALRNSKAAGRFDDIRNRIDVAEEHMGAVPVIGTGELDDGLVSLFDYLDEGNIAELEARLGEKLPTLNTRTGRGFSQLKEALPEFPGVRLEENADKVRKTTFGLLGADIVTMVYSTSPAAAKSAAPGVGQVDFTLYTNTPNVLVYWWWFAIRGSKTPMAARTSGPNNSVTQLMQSGGVGFSIADPNNSLLSIDDNGPHKGRHVVGPGSPDSSATNLF